MWSLIEWQQLQFFSLVVVWKIHYNDDFPLYTLKCHLKRTNSGSRILHISVYDAHIFMFRRLLYVLNVLCWIVFVLFLFHHTLRSSHINSSSFFFLGHFFFVFYVRFVVRSLNSILKNSLYKVTCEIWTEKYQQQAIIKIYTNRQITATT